MTLVVPTPSIVPTFDYDTVSGPSWSLVVGNWKTGPERELTQWSGLEIAMPLLEGWGLSVTIPGTHDSAHGITQLETDLWAYRNLQLVFRGRVTNIEDELTADAHTRFLGVSDYRRLLNRRITWGAWAFNQTDQWDIAWTLISHTQAQPGGNLGITRGAPGIPTGVKRDRHYDEGSNIGELLDNLSQVENGFDWGVDEQRRFNIYHPERGRTLQAVMDYGGSVATAKRTVNTESFINAVRVSGADTTVAAQRATAGISVDPRGRWEEQFGFPDVTQNSTLIEKANEFLRRQSVFVGSWSVALRQNSWKDASPTLPVLPGDTISLTVNHGCQDFSSIVRVTEVSIKAEGNGDEMIELAAVDK